MTDDRQWHQKYGQAQIEYYVSKTWPLACQQWLHAALNTATANMDLTINYSSNTWVRVVRAVNNNKIRVRQEIIAFTAGGAESKYVRLEFGYWTR